MEDGREAAIYRDTQGGVAPRAIRLLGLIRSCRQVVRLQTENGAGESVRSLPFRQQRRELRRDLIRRNPHHAPIAPNGHRIPISTVLCERFAYACRISKRIQSTSPTRSAGERESEGAVIAPPLRGAARPLGREL